MSDCNCWWFEGLIVASTQQLKFGERHFRSSVVDRFLVCDCRMHVSACLCLGYVQCKVSNCMAGHRRNTHCCRAWRRKWSVGPLCQGTVVLKESLRERVPHRSPSVKGPPTHAAQCRQSQRNALIVRQSRLSSQRRILLQSALNTCAEYPAGCLVAQSRQWIVQSQDGQVAPLPKRSSQTMRSMTHGSKR